MRMRRKGIIEVEPWTRDTDMKGVTVSAVDKRNGSPREGDAVVTDLDDPNNRWLANEKYLAENYEPQANALFPPARHDWHSINGGYRCVHCNGFVSDIDLAQVRDFSDAETKDISAPPGFTPTSLDQRLTFILESRDRTANPRNAV